jgi:Cys-tRNA(Pro)/Cys-tRNA(Cys) deacylase
VDLKALAGSAQPLETMYVSAGRRGLQVAPADLIRLTAAIVAPISAG